MQRQFRQFGVGVGRRRAGQHRFQQPRGDQVGKAPVRRRGVDVVTHRQAKVADVRGAGRFHHILARSHQFDDDERQIGKAQRVCLAAPGQKGRQRLRVGLGRQRFAVRFGHLHHPQPALGRAHDAAQRSAAVRRQKARGADVGRNHDFLDQLACPVVFLLPDANHFFALEHGARLKGLELQRALALPLPAQLLGQRILRPQLRLQARNGRCGGRQAALAFNPGSDGVVGQLGLIAHQRAPDSRTCQHAVGAENNFSYQRQPVLAGIERGEIGRQALRQHRENARRGVDRGRVEPGMVVNRRTLFDQRIDVGNGHQQLHRTVRQHFADRQLVQVQRIVVVDRTPRQAGQIVNGRGSLATGAGDRGQLLHHTARKLGFQPAFGHGAASKAVKV